MNIIICVFCIVIGFFVGSIYTLYKFKINFKKIKFKVNGVQYSMHKNGKVYIDYLNGKFIFKDGYKLDSELMELIYNEKLLDDIGLKMFEHNKK